MRREPRRGESPQAGRKAHGKPEIPFSSLLLRELAGSGPCLWLGSGEVSSRVKLERAVRIGRRPRGAGMVREPPGIHNRVGAKRGSGAR
jgi:hypothetical protein